MTDSALERALGNAGLGLRRRLQAHDRFVVVGFLLTLLPLPPACFAGLLIAGANALLLWRGQLAAAEKEMVGWSVCLGVLNSLLAVYGMWWLTHHLDRLATLPFLPDALMELLRALFGPGPHTTFTA